VRCCGQRPGFLGLCLWIYNPRFYCSSWVNCMGSCIQNYFRQWTKPGNDPVVEIPFPGKGKIKKRLSEWCRDPNDHNCCYAYSTLEKYALFNCRERSKGGCASQRWVSVPVFPWCLSPNYCRFSYYDPGYGWTPRRIDCAEALQNATNIGGLISLMLEVFTT